MAQQDVTLPNDGAGILEAAKASRALHKRADPINRTEVSFLCVEPVLAALGWNTREPRQVRHPDGHVIQLLEKITPLISIHSVEAGKDLPKSAPKDARAPWTIVTNGLTWNVFASEDPKTLVQSISLETPAVARDSLGALAVLSQDGFSSDRLTRSWSPEAVERSITEALSAALASPQDLVPLVRAKLGKFASGLSDEDIAISVGRIKFTVNDAEISVGSTASEEAPAAAKNPAPKNAPKKAGARKGTAKKPSAKTHSKRTGKTVSKAKSSRSTKAADVAAGADAKEMTATGPETTSPQVAASTSSSDTATPETPDWPKEATHVMKRKKTVAYITLDDSTGQTTLLPGSLLTPNIGKTLGAQQTSAREQSLEDGSLKKNGDMLEVTTPMIFDNLRLAASFSAGTLVKDISAWSDREGREVSDGDDLPAQETETVVA